MALRCSIPDEAPWQMHDPLMQRKSWFGMLLAQTPSGGHFWNVYFDHVVRADYQEYGEDNAHGFDMTFEEWCGVAPFRRDPQLVWC
jgi:hypothetical protein